MEYESDGNTSRRWGPGYNPKGQELRLVELNTRGRIETN